MMDSLGKWTNQKGKEKTTPMEDQDMEIAQETRMQTIDDIITITKEKRNVDMNKNSNPEDKTPTHAKIDIKQGENGYSNVNNEKQNIPQYKDKENTDFYETETVSGNYIVSISLKDHAVSKSKKYNLIKIYRVIICEGINPDSIKMTGFSRAEMTTRNRIEANKLLRKSSSGERTINTSIPYRTKYRKGVITEWEGTIEELREQLLPNQGKFSMERLKKRKKKDKQTTWEESKAILIKFQGDSLLTKLLIGYGHVWVRVEPFVESAKLCYKCLRFGHTQIKCRNQNKRCFVCSEEYHGNFNKKPRRYNCGGGTHQHFERLQDKSKRKIHKKNQCIQKHSIQSGQRKGLFRSCI
ncbi:uncharacterized protein LOC143360331 [Halictus rubicundus]|uniref:uncharacterized protein LOC143360331 n=1 Tax=Halictus rubicundus TaxID=77578 RepID=UPI0040362FB3